MNKWTFLVCGTFIICTLVKDARDVLRKAFGDIA